MVKGMISSHLFESEHGLKSFTSTRNTLKEYSSPRFTGEPAKIVSTCRQELAAVLSLNIEQLVFPLQTHSSVVAEVEDVDHKEFKSIDALITNKPGICLCIQTADCVPVLFYDPVNKVIAAAHAGWRGTVGQITAGVITMFTSRFHASPDNILVFMGPSISADNYEVGEEVANAILRSIPEPEKIIEEGSRAKFLINLSEANRQVLLYSGIPAENIEVSDYCTFRDKDLFFSARREGIGTGRLVSGIRLE